MIHATTIVIKGNSKEIRFIDDEKIYRLIQGDTFTITVFEGEKPVTKWILKIERELLDAS